MPIRYRLVQLMREWERLQGEELGSLTFRRLGELTKMSPDTLNRMANNKITRFDSETIDKLCEFFGCRLNDLIYRSEEKEGE